MPLLPTHLSSCFDLPVTGTRHESAATDEALLDLGLGEQKEEKNTLSLSQSLRWSLDRDLLLLLDVFISLNLAPPHNTVVRASL